MQSVSTLHIVAKGIKYEQDTCNYVAQKNILKTLNMVYRAGGYFEEFQYKMC